MQPLMEDEYYRELVKRYLEKKSTDNELEVFAHLLAEGKLDAYLTEAMNAEAGLKHKDVSDIEVDHPTIKRSRHWFSYAAAALVFLSLSGGLFFYIKPQKQISAPVKIVKNDLLPGGNKAILTLANGSKLNLTSVRNGVLAKQGITAIDKQEEGRVVYQANTGEEQDAATTSATLYNTITTPKGGQYQVTLPDGTKAWLNAASSIRFPTEFTGNERTVEISGEVYFEVVKNKQKPFTVSCANQKITVLGTHFNVNAYADEGAIKTTLLEGSVKLSSSSDAVTLKPGQQAQLFEGKKLVVTNEVDIDEVVAWKNGLFQFDKADIRTIMNQIARWYDVEITFTGKLTADHYRGKVSRNVNASKVLRILELSGMHFIIEGRKIIVK